MPERKRKYALIFSMTTVVFLSACHKADSDNGSTDVTRLKKDILSDAANAVILPGYTDLSSKAAQLLAAVHTLNAATTDDNLAGCRSVWRSIRETWEQSEAWLIGPVESDDIDPRIDTWPVDFNELDAILNSNDSLNEAYVNNLEESLKGFHPIEYLLWGEGGNKSAAQFTGRQKEFLLALVQNLNTLCNDVKASWANGYAVNFATAGSNGNVVYPTARSAYEALVDGMSGICDEVANGKIKEPFDAQDPSQEESPFAKNSIIDFTNNIRGVMAMYQGKFTNDGKGIEDLVRHYNLSLDNEIKTKHSGAIASLQAITLPFGEAIISQQTQVTVAMTKINDLAQTLEAKLKPFVQQYGE
jgi:predicted lipoprotein